MGLTCAAVLHVALIVGISRSSTRIMGDRVGQPDGISVELVDAADLMSKSTVAVDPTPPGSPSMAQPPRPDPPRPTPRPSEPEKTTARPIEPEKPEAVPLPGLTPKEREAPPAAKSKPKPQPQSPPQPDLPLQLNLPDMTFSPPSRSAAVSRPPGVTRSGENDEFGRGVIRALRQTMPRPTGTLGRVTVRMFLTEQGNLQEVRVVYSGGDPILDQSVLFAVKQASFPLPPVGATVADRTFLVTYVYR